MLAGKWLRSLLVAAVAVVAIGASDCEEEADPGNLDPPSGTPAAMGDPFRSESAGWVITVTSVSRLDTVEVRGETKAPLGVYLAVEITMENIAPNRQALGGNRFALVDDEERTFRWYPDGTNAAGREELGSNINPGLVAPARIVFDVPEDAVGLQLAVAGGLRLLLGDVADIP